MGSGDTDAAAVRRDGAFNMARICRRPVAVRSRQSERAPADAAPSYCNHQSPSARRGFRREECRKSVFSITLLLKFGDGRLPLWPGSSVRPWRRRPIYSDGWRAAHRARLCGCGSKPSTCRQCMSGETMDPALPFASRSLQILRGRPCSGGQQLRLAILPPIPTCGGGCRDAIPHPEWGQSGVDIFGHDRKGQG